MAAETSQQDPSTRVAASGKVLRITDSAATFRKDGLPLDPGQS